MLVMTSTVVQDYFLRRKVLIAAADGFLGRTAAFRLAEIRADLTLLSRSSAVAGGRAAESTHHRGSQ